MNKREIKFMAWHKARKEMYDVYGFNENFVFKKTIDGLGSDGNPDRIEDVELLEYTSLKDRNGNEIYDGYIVEDKDGIYEVKFGKIGWSAAAFYLEAPDGSSYQLWRSDTLKIIGNIYENDTTEI